MNKLLCRVSEVADVCALGRTKTYELINRGVIRSVRIDGAVRVPISAVEEFVKSLEPTLPTDGVAVESQPITTS